MVFKIPYFVKGLGDGSASVKFTESLTEAREMDEGQEEPFAESTVDELVVKIDGDRILYRIWKNLEEGYAWVEARKDRN